MQVLVPGSLVWTDNLHRDSVLLSIVTTTVFYMSTTISVFVVRCVCCVTRAFTFATAHQPHSIRQSFFSGDCHCIMYSQRYVSKYGNGTCKRCDRTTDRSLQKFNTLSEIFYPARNSTSPFGEAESNGTYVMCQWRGLFWYPSQTNKIYGAGGGEKVNTEAVSSCMTEHNERLCKVFKLDRIFKQMSVLFVCRSWQ